MSATSHRHRRSSGAHRCTLRSSGSSTRHAGLLLACLGLAAFAPVGVAATVRADRRAGLPRRPGLGGAHARRPRRRRSCASPRWRPTGPGFVRARRWPRPGPRIVVFEVGGVIDLGVKELRITEPFLTIAGQTAPQPGITLIRGGLIIATHDVVIRHIRVRPGDGRRGEDGRPGLRRDHHRARRARRDRRPLLADLGHRREPVGLEHPLPRRERAAVARSGLAPHHLQQQHHRRGPGQRHARQGRALQGHADPRPRQRHPDRRQPLRAQLRAQPAVQGRRARAGDQQPDLRPGPARACTTT